MATGSRSERPMTDLPSSHAGHRQRLRERYLAAGCAGMHNYEVLELLLSYAIPRKDVKQLAKELLARFGTLRGIMDADIREIESVPGMGVNSTILIKLIKEVSALYLAEKAKEQPQISNSRELLDYCKTAFGGLKNERFVVIYLNAQNRIIDVETIQEGIVNQAVVYPRKILEGALLKNASSLILVHNHPSGEVRPSAADVSLTKNIRETARVLNIEVNDHIIVGGNRHFSFREEGVGF